MSGEDFIRVEILEQPARNEKLRDFIGEHGGDFTRFEMQSMNLTWEWSWGDHKSLAVALVSAATALALAAADLLVAAAWSLVVMGAALVAAGIAWCYRRLPEDRRSALLSKRRLRRSAAASIVGACAISSFYWYLGMVPHDLPMWVYRALAPIFPKIDFIPSAFALLLPVTWRSGFHHYFTDGGTYCFPGPFWWETMRLMRAAIPGYFIFFMASSLATRLLTYLLRNRSTGTDSADEPPAAADGRMESARIGQVIEVSDPSHLRSASAGESHAVRRLR